MKKYIICAVPAILAMATISFPSIAYAAESSFQNSCQNMRLNTDQNGAWISAECKTVNGSLQRTTYQLSGLVNDDGILRHRSGQRTSFQNSCRDAVLQWKTNAVRIFAYCRTASGGERETTIGVMNISNNNGRLSGN